MEGTVDYDGQASGTFTGHKEAMGGSGAACKAV